MAESKSLEVQQKQELKDVSQEKTVPGKYFVPYTDIYETDKALVILMDMPGVEKKNVDVKLEKNVLSVEGHIDFSKYEHFEPVYTEYNIGHFTRSFSLSREIDIDRISAKVADGVLTLDLPKVAKVTPRRIEVS